eukprot:4376152-Amphidinium_carterae.1
MSPTARFFLDYVSRAMTTVDHQSAPSVALRIAQCHSISRQRDTAQAVHKRLSPRWTDLAPAPS